MQKSKMNKNNTYDKETRKIKQSDNMDKKQ